MRIFEDKSKQTDPVNPHPGQLGPLRITLPATKEVLDEFSERTQIFVVCFCLVLSMFFSPPELGNFGNRHLLISHN